MPTEHCCDIHRKVALGVARVYSEEECGVPESALADFHDFSYTSDTKLPVSAALTFRFCPWCGTRRDGSHQSRTVEVIRSR